MAYRLHFIVSYKPKSGLLVHARCHVQELTLTKTINDLVEFRYTDFHEFRKTNVELVIMNCQSSGIEMSDFRKPRYELVNTKKTKFRYCNFGMQEYNKMRHIFTRYTLCGPKYIPMF